MKFNDNKGITLIELLVSIALMAIALVPMVQMLQMAVKLNTDSRSLTKAIMAGRTIMSRLILPKTDDLFSTTYNTDFASLTNIGDATNPKPAPDSSDIKWYAVVTTPAFSSDCKKIELHIRYQRKNNPQPREYILTTYRYKFE